MDFNIISCVMAFYIVHTCIQWESSHETNFVKLIIKPPPTETFSLKQTIHIILCVRYYNYYNVTANGFTKISI